MSTTAPENTADTATDTVTDTAPQPVRYDPIMVVAAAGGADDPTFAIWQVETDPDVQLGDFSGAWLIDGAGIHGFAAEADWIEGTDDRGAMLAALLRYPVLFAGPEAAAKVLPQEVALVDVQATEAALNDALASAKQHFSDEFPGKKQPPWGSLRPLEEFRGAEAGGSGGDGASGAGGDGADGAGEAERVAVAAALQEAAAMRGWIAQYNAFDKLRVRRIGAVSSDFAQAQPIPVVFAQRG